MALEDELAKLTAATQEQNELLKQLLAKTGAAGGTVPAATAAEPTKATATKAEKPAATKAEKPADTGVTVKSVLAKFKPWLDEFAEGHAELTARRAKLKELLTKLGAAKISEITDADKLGKLNTWFDTKSGLDNGFGPGRLAADPVAEEDPSAEEEL